MQNVGRKSKVPLSTYGKMKDEENKLKELLIRKESEIKVGKFSPRPSCKNEKGVWKRTPRVWLTN